MASNTTERPKMLLLGEIEQYRPPCLDLPLPPRHHHNPTATNRPSFLAEARSGAFNGCVAAYRTFDSISVTGRIDAEPIRPAPTLRFICHNGAGYDQIDVGACRERGVRVSNTPTAVDDATADAAVRGVVIVNTARGAIIDEAALVEALDSGQVGSAGLDVFEKEPDIHPGLLANPRVLLIPHMGTWTVETETKMEEWAISNVRMAIEEGKLRSIVPEQRDM
ncbi:glyoxylate reductase [Collariella sp. IMI 366227]|nr:glyoxylate reductase [Collariella sp. IMI 366227]